MFAHTALRSLTASVVRSPQLLTIATTIGTQGGNFWRQQRLQAIQTARSGPIRQLPAPRRGYAQVPEDKDSYGERNPDGAKSSPLASDTSSELKAADPGQPEGTSSTLSSQPQQAGAADDLDTNSSSLDVKSSNSHPPPPPHSLHPSPLIIGDPHSRTFPSQGRGADSIPRSAYISSADRKRERIARFSFTVFFLSLATGALYFTRNWDSEEDIKKHAEDAPNGYTPGMMYKRLGSRIRDITNYYEQPVFEKLLPDPLPPEYQAPYTLVLGLEDLLIHTEWDKKYGWRSAKRPGLDYFLGYMTEKMGAYPAFVTQFLSREATRYKDGKYIKDLSHLNRDLSKVILVDTKKEAGEMQPENTIIISAWKGDPRDRELLSLINVLEFIAAMGVPDVRPVISEFGDKHIPTEFAIREAVARKKFKENLAEEQAKRPDVKLGFLSSLMGLKPAPEKEKMQEKMLQDLIREKGQENYRRLLKLLEEQRPQHEEEERRRQKEMAEASKTSLSKVLTGTK